MKAIQHVLLSAFVLCAAAGNSHATFITLTYDDVDTGFGIHQYNPAIDGISHTISGSDSGNSSTTTTNYSKQNLNTIHLEVTGEHVHAGAVWTDVYSVSYTGFIANLDSLTYAIDGEYLAQVRAGTIPTISSIVSLIDLTAGQLVFHSHIGSRNSLSVEHIVGVGGGDHGVVVFGNATGSLIQGHQYAWNTTAVISRREEEGAETTGSGRFALTVSNAAAVPEPASLTLFSLGAVGLAVGRRRSRRSKLRAGPDVSHDPGRNLSA